MFDKGHCASEYSYLEQTYSPVWTGPDYWKKSYKGKFWPENCKNNILLLNFSNKLISSI